MKSWIGMSKLTALLLCCCITLLQFTACGRKQVEEEVDKPVEQVSSDTSNEKSEETVVDNEPLDIEWLSYNCWGVPDKNSEIVKRIEEKYNVNFKFWFLDGSQWEQMLAIKLAADEVPDIMRVHRNLAKYVEQGVVAEITDDMMAKIPNYTKLVDQYVDDKDDFYARTMLDGKRYGIRNLKEFFSTIVVWNKEWLTNVGINKLPETLDEFEEAMYKFANEDPDGNSKDDTYGLSENAMNVVFGAYGPLPLGNMTTQGASDLEYAKRDGKIVIQCIQPEMKEPLALLQKWYKDGLIDPEFITGENKGGYWAVSHAFVNGKVGVTGKVWPYHWNPPLTEGDPGGRVYQEMIKMNPEAEFGKTFDIGFAVTGPDGKAGTIGGSMGSGDVVTLTTRCIEDPRKVDVLLDLFNDNTGDYDQYLLVNKGIEGEHYTVGERGSIVTAEAVKTPQSANEAGISVLSTYAGNPEFDLKANPFKIEFGRKYSGPGYVRPSRPASPVVDMYQADLVRLSLEYYIGVITGEKSIDDFDNFVAEVRANGGDEIEEDLTERYNKLIGK